MKWYKSKTIWTGILGVLGAVSGCLIGEIAMDIAIQIGITSLLGIFLRDGIEKNK